MKYTYTDAAREEIETFLAHQKNSIENLVSNEKYVFGDENVEITAADVRRGANRIRIIPKRKKITNLLNLAKLYTVMGIFFASFGLLYPSIEELFRKNSVQATIVVTGFTVSFIGIMLWILLRSKENENSLLRKEIGSPELEDYLKYSFDRNKIE